MTDTSATPLERCEYRLTYRVSPPVDCPVTEFSGRVSEVSVFQSGDTRRCEFLIETEDGLSIREYERAADSPCPCTVVFEAGSVPHRSIAPEGAALELSTYVTDTSDAQTITEALEAVCERAELVDYKTLSEESRDWSIQIDLGELTEKRREAFLRALEDGYYKTPSETTIEAMAATIGISGSAFGTRLRKAEQTVFEQIRESV